MAWFSNALQKVNARTGDLKEKARDAGRAIAERTQRLEEAVVNNLQGTLTAKEVEARLEGDARRLLKPAQAAEILQRWLQLISSGPQTRYQDDAPVEDSPSARSPKGRSRAEHVSFQQVFLRSRALEYAIDTVARTPELRAALRGHALPPPESWSDERPPPVLFAHCFVELLRATIGPPEVWLSLFSALLGSEQDIADEPSHVWLVQLLAGLRGSAEEVAVRDRERQILSIEVAAKRGLAAVEAIPETQASPGSLATLLAALTKRSNASGKAFRAISLRKTLSTDLERAAANQQALARKRAGSAASVSAVAMERARALEADSAKQRQSFKELCAELGQRAADSRDQLSALEPVGAELQREFEQAETTKEELLRQVAQLTEKLDALCQNKAQHQREQDKARGELQRLDNLLVTNQAAEDEASRRAEDGGALAKAVGDLARKLAKSLSGDADGDGEVQSSEEMRQNALTASEPEDLVARRLLAEAENSRELAWASAVALAEHEAMRLADTLRAADVCAEVIQEREKSRATMRELGVPSSTLESDTVGEAELAQAMRGSLEEVGRYGPEVEALCKTLEELTTASSTPDGEAVSGAAVEASSRRSQELADVLRQRLVACEDRRARLIVLAPLVGVSEPSSPSEKSSTDPFKFDSRTAVGVATAAMTPGDGAGAVEGVGRGASLLGRFARAGTSRLGGVAQADDDPFLLIGADLLTEAAEATASAEVAALAAEVSPSSGLAVEPAAPLLAILQAETVASPAATSPSPASPAASQPLLPTTQPVAEAALASVSESRAAVEQPASPQTSGSEPASLGERTAVAAANAGALAPVPADPAADASTAESAGVVESSPAPAL